MKRPAFRSSETLAFLLKATPFLLVCVISTLLNARLVATATYSTPYADEFRMWRLLDSASSGHFNVMEVLTPHNGHPYPIVKTIMWTVVAAGWPWSTLYWATVALYGGAGWLASRLIVESIGDKVIAYFAGVTAVLIASTCRNWENLYWGMQIAFPMWLFALLQSALLLERYRKSRSIRDALWASAAAWVGLFSFGAGIVSFCVVQFELTRISPPSSAVRRGLLVSSGLGVALFFLLRHNAPIPEEGYVETFDKIASEPRLFAEHFLVMLGNGLVTPSVRIGLNLVMAIGAAICAATSIALLSGGFGGPVAVPVGARALMLTGLLLAALTTVVKVAGDHYQPDASRYVTLTAPIFVGALPLIEGLPLGASVRRAISALVCLGVALISIVSYRGELRIAPYQRDRMAKGHAQLCGGSVTGLNRPETIDPSALSAMRRAFCR